MTAVTVVCDLSHAGMNLAWTVLVLQRTHLPQDSGYLPEMK